MVHLVVGVLGMNVMLGPMRVGNVTTFMMVAMMMVVVFPMLVFVAVMSLPMMNVIRR